AAAARRRHSPDTECRAIHRRDRLEAEVFVRREPRAPAGILAPPHCIGVGNAMSNLQNIRIAAKESKAPIARAVTLEPAADNTTPLKVGLVQINNSFSGQNYLPYSAGLLQAYAAKNARHPARYDFGMPIYSRIPVAQAVEQLKHAD